MDYPYTLYHSFFGVDISKASFVVSSSENSSVIEYPNTIEGFKKFLSQHKNSLTNSLVVLEATGGYEDALVDFLIENGCKVHKAHANKIKNFARSFGRKGKTDQIDARMIRKYGEERHKMLPLYEVACKEFKLMKELMGRRDDLVRIRVQEKNRYQTPNGEETKESIERIIKLLSEEIEAIEKRIKELEEEDNELQEKKKVLEEIEGIGDHVSTIILSYMPEIGKIGRREAASLTGVAPYPKDSGTVKGYRSTGGGRGIVRRNLFVAAMSASKTDKKIGRYYKKMVERGKAKMVALVAVMRKIITIANAKMKEYYAKKEGEYSV